MKILLTGGTGFLGSIIKDELQNNHEIISLGKSEKNDIQCDLAKNIPNVNSIDVVIHSAGKAHIYPKTEAEIQLFYDINITGTENLLKAIESKSIKAFVFISSVSVYGLSSGENITEGTPLKGNSPYAISKIKGEKLVENFSKKRKIPYLILRLPLIVGKNPKGNLQKIENAIQKGIYIRIAKGNAKKSMVLATDIAQLIQQWIQKPTQSGIYNLTDGYHPTFYEIEEAICTKYNKRILFSIPISIANLLGKIGDTIKVFPINTNTIQKITNTFTFSDQKAKKELNWKANKAV